MTAERRSGGNDLEGTGLTGAVVLEHPPPKARWRRGEDVPGLSGRDSGCSSPGAGVALSLLDAGAPG